MQPLISADMLRTIELPKPNTLVWSVSVIKLWKECRRKFFWRYIAQLSPKRMKEYFIVGTAAHTVLKVWYKSGCTANIAGLAMGVRRAAIASALAVGDDDEDTNLMVSLGMMHGMLMGYAHVYKSDPLQYDLTKCRVETPFNIKIDGIPFTGQIDFIVPERKSKLLTLWDHKTPRNITEGVLKKLPLDSQLRGYMYAAKAVLGVRIGKVVLNQVRKSQLRQRTKKKPETYPAYVKRVQLDYIDRPENYFNREVLLASDGDMDSFVYELRQINAELNAVLRGDYGNPRDPRSWMPNENACDANYGTCEMLEMCLSGLDKSTVRMYQVGVQDSASRRGTYQAQPNSREK